MGERKRSGDIQEWNAYRDEMARTMDRRQLRRRDFQAGYRAASDRLPSREEIAACIDSAEDAWIELFDLYPDDAELPASSEHVADAVLALTRERIEGEA